MKTPQLLCLIALVTRQTKSPKPKRLFHPQHPADTKVLREVPNTTRTIYILAQPTGGGGRQPLSGNTCRSHLTVQSATLQSGPVQYSQEPLVGGALVIKRGTDDSTI